MYYVYSRALKMFDQFLQPLFLCGVFHKSFFLFIVVTHTLTNYASQMAWLDVISNFS
jgi:hypothetical protein